ncbi:hypothetical protein SAMN00017477_1342 [Peptoniphilus asaccharolyticus DSM 20463]|uniref:Uncharacterized protein n=1 Tax=Peptoniphilus asaccharolyticus DSM 20463 TaxID=573058 RepID=A0A1W1V486_PEPAS|nr:hypothetical protein [Peptoniphilus asaccharolyticus]MBL7576288.1 hypothetical protein [Peptoniphilus asaccharolyticus]SMB88106.1 hypothetical protein SAMN00017477_1342 [Peptoniphilus asaccharolyticus DSM 20463]
MQGFLNNNIDVEILVSLALIVISLRAYSSRKYSTLIVTLLAAVLVKYAMTLLNLFRLEVPSRIYPVIVGSGASTSFLKTVMAVDLLCLVVGIIAYRKKSYKTLLILVFIVVLFQYLGLVL